MTPSDVRLTGFLPAHEARLRSLLSQGEWREVLGASREIREIRGSALRPRPSRYPEQVVVDQLRRFNEARVRERISSGERDREALLDDLAGWPRDWPGEPELSFLGLTVLPECNFRCVYCNKPHEGVKTPDEVWRRTIREASGGPGDRGVYIHFTGGEPLLRGDELYGDEGLIRYAVECGAAVNVNTNASLVTPKVALRLIAAGVSRVHVSLDSHDRDTQNRLIPGGDRFAAILRGIANLQIAREVLAVDEPQIHINCVLTRHNLDHLTDLLAFLLERRKVRHKREKDRMEPDMRYRDLLLHVIPVGGEENADIRPTADEFREFYGRIWSRASAFWDGYQARMGVPEEGRVDLKSYGFYSPYLRVEHRADLRAYADLASHGVYSRTALLDRCYVAPTQAFVLPDGSQYWCGAHTMSRPPALGNVNETGVLENIRRGAANLGGLPDGSCANCPGATLYINCGVDRALRKAIETWIDEAEGRTHSA